MHFTKMQGLGNDYVYIDGMKERVEHPEKLAVSFSDRHFGIGADGIIVIGKSQAADVKMEMYNADGSQGKMCGNGIRCVAKYVYENGIVPKKNIRIETLSGVKETNILPDGEVRVNMGYPKVERIRQQLELSVFGRRRVTSDCISMGNPHRILYLNEMQETEQMETLELERIGPALECLGTEAHRRNVEIVKVLDRKTLELRVWERGSGETLACGTGACAAAVSSILRNLTEREVRIKLKGGNLLVKWGEDGRNLYMTGPAVTVFKGDIIV